MGKTLLEKVTNAYVIPTEDIEKYIECRTIDFLGAYECPKCQYLNKITDDMKACRVCGTDLVYASYIDAKARARNSKSTNSGTT